MQVKDYNDGAWHLSWLEGGVHIMEGGTEKMMAWINGLLEENAEGSKLERWVILFRE